MDTIFQIAAIGALLALIVLVVLADAVGSTPKTRPARAKKARKERRLKAIPSVAGEQPAGDEGGVTDILSKRPPAAMPLPLGRESIQAALRHREIGQPMLQPDPERFVQSEVLELAGPAARIGALLRLVFWIMLAGLGIGLMILGAVRGIALFFENLLGV